MFCWNKYKQLRDTVVNFVWNKSYFTWKYIAIIQKVNLLRVTCQLHKKNKKQCSVHACVNVLARVCGILKNSKDILMKEIDSSQYHFFQKLSGFT